MRKKMFLVLSSLCSFFCIQASGTHPFEVLDHAAHDIPRIRLKFTEEAFPAAKFDKTELERGFRVTAVDMNNDWRLPFVYKGAEMDNSLKLLTARGEYTSCGFSLFAIKHLNDVKITFPTLKDGKGNTIDGKELSMLEIAPAGKIPRFEGAQLLYAPELKTIVADEQVNLLLMVNIPEKSVAGTYTGKIEISSNAGTAAVLNINLRVVDVILPEIGNFGFFINGNLYNPQIHKEERIMQKGFVKENLKKYFTFYKTRHLNSINVYEIFPDLRYIDGQVMGRFDDLSELAKAMNECNLNGKFIIDLRNIGYWANTLSDKLDKLGGKAPAGDIGIRTEQGKMRINADDFYPEKAKEIYAQAIHLLIKQAKAEKWPEILLFADEELGNRYTWKLNNYESFMPVIMKECPELAICIDNGIGWGREDAVEFAVRDNVKTRQYNSWTEESLALAEKADAEVWTFNYGPYRLSFGFSQLRMNSYGSHQWADLWDSYNFQWQYSRLSEKGVVSSLQIERMHEGIVDYFAGMYLKKLIAEQDACGNKALADYGRQVIKEVTADLPVLHDPTVKLALAVNDGMLNARRWHVFQAIDLLRSGNYGAENAADYEKVAGEIAVSIVPNANLARPNDFTIKVRNISSGDIIASAELKENFWSDRIGPLTYLADYETKLRALSSSEEDFALRNKPDYSIAYLASLPEGMAIYVEVDKVQACPPYKYARKDDDGSMWEDDCVEVFFAASNNKICHFMFNSAGHKVFMSGGEVIPAKDIRTFIKSPLNAEGGTITKFLIPWYYFGLQKQPMTGTVWEFNIGREFHTGHNRDQSLTSWAKVRMYFGEQTRWGRLVFAPEHSDAAYFKPTLNCDPILSPLAITGQILTFNVISAASDGVKTLPLLGVLTHESRKTIELKEENLPVGIMQYSFDTANLPPGKWTLQLFLKGQSADPANTVSFTLLPTPWK